MKSSEVSIKTRSTPASLSFKGQATTHTTVKWSISLSHMFHPQILPHLSQFEFIPLTFTASTRRKKIININFLLSR